MNLYLIRHADALANDDDSIRALSPLGRAEVAQLVRNFQDDERFRPDEIWFSSLQRAQQTAQLLQAGLKLNVPLILTDGITPEDDPRAFLLRLENLSRSVAVVSHEPFLGVLAALLARPNGPAYFGLQKAEVVAFEKRPFGWSMVWRVLPEDP